METKPPYPPAHAYLSLIKFFLDENFPQAFCAGLRLRGIDAVTVPEVQRRGLSDEDQLAYAHEMVRVLVTQDRDFLTICYTCLPHSGIVYVPMGHSIGEFVRYLELVRGAMSSEEMGNHVESF